MLKWNYLNNIKKWKIDTITTDSKGYWNYWYQEIKGKTNYGVLSVKIKWNTWNNNTKEYWNLVKGPNKHR